ncbi:MAG: DNA polymerase III subunit delta [Paludibacteraceae bacterium]|nr:DNA polymerase III subunit delta [Paludibacteraceae bacterium]MBN2788253.1 DNA polymerase III subunit delta [Paludibacteraceae bacterium]
MAKQDNNFNQLFSSLKKKEYKPIYLLMGEEPYYIDLLSNYMQENILSEMEQEFNLTVLYGKDVDMPTVINAAKRFPMMAPYQLIIVKEAQHIKNYELLLHYLQNIQSSTILVFCYKYGTIDKRLKIVGEIDKVGVVFTSNALRDYQVTPWIKDYVRTKNLSIDEKAAALLAEFLGTDLGRIVSEVDKLIITKPANSNVITDELIEKNIGISKDYNNFELQNALLTKNEVKAQKIVFYFDKNPKNNPLVVTISVLFGFYVNLLQYHYTDNKNPASVASELGINPFFVKDYETASKNYSASKCMQNISLIREFDAKAKGVKSRASNGELLKELVFKLMH